MYFGICQIIFTALLIMSLGIHLANHGKPKEGNYSFGMAFVSCAIQFVLLYFGGFYS